MRVGQTLPMMKIRSVKGIGMENDSEGNRRGRLKIELSLARALGIYGGGWCATERFSNYVYMYFVVCYHFHFPQSFK